jgi:hypothetical protein
MKNHHFHQHHHNQLPTHPVSPTAEVETSQAEKDFVPSPDEISRRAYFAYVNEGSAEGRDVQHWLDAEAELIKERNCTRVHGYHNKT